jgi:hypothetical protein
MLKLSTYFDSYTQSYPQIDLTDCIGLDSEERLKGLYSVMEPIISRIVIFLKPLYTQTIIMSIAKPYKYQTFIAPNLVYL